MMTAVRTYLYLLAALAAATGMGPTEAHAQTKLKMILDWKYQGQMAIYFLAADRGYFKDEGLEIAFDQGEGAGAAAPKIASGAYDIGFGSLDSVIALQAARPAEAPVAVFQVTTDRHSSLPSAQKVRSRRRRIWRVAPSAGRSSTAR